MNKFCLINLTTNDKIPIDANELVVGREIISNCTDKRISRKHAVIKVQEDEQLLVIALHTNPIFYRTETEDEVKILYKDSEKYLKENDKIGFLPDQFWFRVSIQQSPEEKDEQDTGTEELDLDENIILKDNNNSSSVIDNNTVVTGIRVKNTNEINETASSSLNAKNSPKRKLPSWLIDQENNLPSSSKKSKCDSNENISTPEKSNNVLSTSNDVSTSDAADEFIGVTQDDNIGDGDSNDNKENLNLPSDPSEDLPSTSSDIGNVKIKKEKDDLAVANNIKNIDVKPDIKVKVEVADSSSSDLRPSCDYGIKCYRRNPLHRTEYAHPGDNDYRRPNVSPSDDNAPDCPFGTACYRRNPTHFAKYKHPPSTNPKLNRKNRKRNSRSQEVLQKRQRTKIKLNVDYGIEDDNSDEDFSSDDDDSYKPSESDPDDLSEQNPLHRFENAHPGDSDYRRPNFPPAPDGSPDCPFGNACYRRNPTHFQNFKHPPN